ncbi:hypothetical protein QBC32DRAFT_196384, partial [Pseudoneurospora amorphoporcata]
KLKRDDIGTFNPFADDPEDMGMIESGSNAIYTDSTMFKDRLLTLLEDDPKGIFHKQLVCMWPLFLQGAAHMWWHNQMTPEKRRELVTVEQLTSALVKRFTPDSAMATRKFNAGRLTLYHVYKDENAATTYILKQLRLARAMGILSKDGDNWLGIMVQIWNSFSTNIKTILRPPTAFSDTEVYLEEIEKTRAILV